MRDSPSRSGMPVVLDTSHESRIASGSGAREHERSQRDSTRPNRYDRRGPGENRRNGGRENEHQDELNRRGMVEIDPSNSVHRTISRPSSTSFSIRLSHSSLPPPSPPSVS